MLFSYNVKINKMEKLKLIKIDGYDYTAMRKLHSEMIVPYVLAHQIESIYCSVEYDKVPNWFDDNENPLDFLHKLFFVVLEDGRPIVVYGDIDEFAECINGEKTECKSTQK